LALVLMAESWLVSLWSGLITYAVVSITVDYSETRQMTCIQSNGKSFAER